MSDAQDREEEIRARVEAANDETDDFITHLAQGQLERNARHDVAWLLARLDAERAATAEAWKLIGAYLHAEIDKDIHRDDRTCAKRWLGARDAVISGHDAFIAAAGTGAGGDGDG